MTAKSPADCRLYLITPPRLDDLAAFAHVLAATLDAGDVAALQIRLKDAPEAKNQIAFADVILLNKTDLVTEAELAAVEAGIRRLNPLAPIHRAVGIERINACVGPLSKRPPSVWGWDLARKARQAGSDRELGFLLVNETLALVPYRQAALVALGALA